MIQSYDCPDSSAASEHVKRWLSWVNRKEEAPMRAIGRTVSRHFYRILYWHIHNISNSFLEGLNRMIQTTKRIGRGYPNTQNFMTMNFFRHGRLDTDIRTSRYWVHLLRNSTNCRMIRRRKIDPSA